MDAADRAEWLTLLSTWLSNDPDYKVLRRFQPVPHYGAVIEPANLRYGVYLDTETTGIDPHRDLITQLGMVRFEYDTNTGAIGAVGPTLDLLEDPGVPLEEAITDLTGITDEMVKGKKIDDAQVAEVMDGVAVVIAHNAEYDRKISERRFPGLFQKFNWACTQFDIPWKDHGIRTGMLEYLVMSATHSFYTAHRALDDCLAGVHLLARGNLGDEVNGDLFAMRLLLNSARGPRFRVWATGSPYEVKRELKSRQYRAYYTPRGDFGCWWKEVPEAQLEAEVNWCMTNAMCTPTVVRITAKDRYSVRADIVPRRKSYGFDSMSPYA